MITSPQGEVKDPLHGVMWDMSEAEYRSRPGLNHSSLKHIEKNPLEFQYQLTAPYSPPSKEMAFGLYAEWLIETRGHGDLDSSKFVLQPDDYKPQAKEWRKWKAEQEAARKVIITPQIKEDAEGLLCVIRERPVWELIGRLKMQVPVFAVVELGGMEVQCKALLDLYDTGEDPHDVKTSTDCSGNAWIKHVVKMCYHTQAAWYLLLLSLVGERPSRFTHIVLEKTPPYQNRSWTLPDDLVRLGRRVVWGWFEQYVKCAKAGEWPGYPPTPEELPMDYWTKKQLESNE